MCYFAIMAVRSCRVTIQDLEGIAHTVEVTAESLYEAVAQGLVALRRNDWVSGFQQGIVKVSVADVRVEHQVKLADFTKWLERRGVSSPREMIQRQRLRSMLGMPARS
jgi:predicted helicase